MGCCANLGGGRSQSGDGFEVEQVVVLSAVLSSLHMLWNRSLHDVISPSNQDHPTTHPLRLLSVSMGFRSVGNRMAASVANRSLVRNFTSVSHRLSVPHRFHFGLNSLFQCTSAALRSHFNFTLVSPKLLIYDSWWIPIVFCILYLSQFLNSFCMMFGNLGSNILDSCCLG